MKSKNIMEEYSKEQLEIEKLKLEIENGKKPFYKKLSFYSYLSPVAVSIAAIIFSIWSGFFENESKLLDLRKENLKHEINLFVLQKDSLLTTVTILKKERDSIYYENNKLKTQNGKLESLSNELTVNQNVLNKLVQKITDSIAVKKTEYDTLFHKYAKLNGDKLLLATKMKELEKAIDPLLKSNEETKTIFTDILQILDENLGGFKSSSMLLLFSE
ncbi:MAG: hypothetical protein OQK29_11170 [Ignavibacteriaceae bacterium]|jgi:hypothetical protein|nr:hypothetical protein [Ignavibacteriaceae bacterium]